MSTVVGGTSQPEEHTEVWGSGPSAGGPVVTILEFGDTTTVLGLGELGLMFVSISDPGISGYYYLVVGDGVSPVGEIPGATFPASYVVSTMIDDALSGYTPGGGGPAVIFLDTSDPDWANTVLSAGQLGYVNDPGGEGTLVYVGDGVTAVESLGSRRRLPTVRMTNDLITEALADYTPGGGGGAFLVVDPDNGEAMSAPIPNGALAWITGYGYGYIGDGIKSVNDFENESSFNLSAAVGSIAVTMNQVSQGDLGDRVNALEQGAGSGGVSVAAFNAHVSATTDVHGIPSTTALLDAVDDVTDGPDFALVWANLMA